jgi:SAM-dependent methyltransferase
MYATLLDVLVCPDCMGSLTLSEATEQGAHVMTGRLTCDQCHAAFPVTGGIPRMNRRMEHLEQVAHAFSVEWKTHHEGAWEKDTLFGLTRDEDWQLIKQGLAIDDDGLKGHSILEAGCGSGRPLRLMAEHGAEMAVGIDINEAVDEAFAACADLDNVHVVQANIFALPLKPQSFDFVWSNGVIHHTHDPAGAAAALARQVTPGGTLYIWVYAKRFSPFKLVKRLVDGLAVTRMSDDTLKRLSAVLAYSSLVSLTGYRAIRRVPPLRPKTERARRTLRPRTIDELKLTWFDTIAPQYVSTHSEAEVLGWFRKAGFGDLETLDEPKVGVRGRAPAQMRSGATQR